MHTSKDNELDDIVQSMSQKQTSNKAEGGKIPLLPPGSYKKIAKVGFSPLDGEKPRSVPALTEKEIAPLEDLEAKVEVIFGHTTMTLKELAGLEKGTLLPLEEFCDAPLEIHVNGVKIGYGEVVAVDDRFGVQIVSFCKGDNS